jgi:hypothetical protein
MPRNASSNPSPPPQRQLPDQTWEHFALYQRVREAVAALPTYFRTETYISGVLATDIHTLNTVLGATIEQQAVATLNAMRMVWDPDQRYALYRFVRQPQTFPDVLLRRTSDGHILLGIELKGWYLLAAEGEPSFRYSVTPAVSHPWDLVVVVPWALANVISGSPVVFDPYIESARYAAEYRNYWWQHVRQSASDRRITAPTGMNPYPTKSDPILDRPASDGGNNFGRFARTGIMDAYLAEMKSRLLCGVRVGYWLMFLKAFQGQKQEAEIQAGISALANEIAASNEASEGTLSPLLVILEELKKLAGLPGG